MWFSFLQSPFCSTFFKDSLPAYLKEWGSFGLKCCLVLADYATSCLDTLSEVFVITNNFFWLLNYRCNERKTHLNHYLPRLWVLYKSKISFKRSKIIFHPQNTFFLFYSKAISVSDTTIHSVAQTRYLGITLDSFFPRTSTPAITSPVEFPDCLFFCIPASPPSPGDPPTASSPHLL